MLADDDPIVCRALRAMLEASDLAVTGKTRDGASVLTAVRDARPSVALVDVGLPASGSVALVKTLAGVAPAVRVILLDLSCDDRSTAAIAESLFLSRETVRSHVKHITRKLGVSGRGEAIAMAASLRGGWRSPGRRRAPGLKGLRAAVHPAA